jgi:hypothetical protein
VHCRVRIEHSSPVRLLCTRIVHCACACAHHFKLLPDVVRQVRKPDHRIDALVVVRERELVELLRDRVLLAECGRVPACGSKASDESARGCWEGSLSGVQRTGYALLGVVHEIRKRDESGRVLGIHLDRFAACA